MNTIRMASFWRNLLIFILPIIFLAADLDDARKANNAYEEGNYQKAEKLYRKALQDQSKNPKLLFNLANALAKQGKTKEALRFYQRYKTQVDQPEMKARAEYNIGNLFANKKKWNKAARHYRRALHYDPTDREAKHNYELALKKLKKQKQKKQQKQNQQNNKQKQQKNKNKQNRQQQNQQSKKRQNRQQQKNQQKRNQSQKQKKKKRNKSSQSRQKEQPQKKKNQKGRRKQARPRQMSKTEAQKILQALQNDEKNLLMKQLRKKQSSKNSNNAKDW